MQLAPITQVVTAGGTIPAGKRHIEFILSADFVGTINGAAVLGTGSAGVAAVGVYSLDSGALNTLNGLNYTISAGGAILTIF